MLSVQKAAIRHFTTKLFIDAEALFSEIRQIRYEKEYVKNNDDVEQKLVFVRIRVFQFEKRKYVSDGGIPDEQDAFWISEGEDGQSLEERVFSLDDSDDD